MALADMVDQGATAPALLMSAALVLGALHALEPGHAKTMMAGFVIAVRGTVGQAILLGACAAFSHSLIVWLLALAGLAWGDRLIGERLEPWFMIAAGAIILAIAGWTVVRARAASRMARAGRAGHHHVHGHHHDHHHGGHDAHHHDHAHMDEDAHARAHGAAIERTFAGGRATTGQIVLFGLGGGLIPCAAAITVLLVCLQLDRFWLGVGLVAAFSAGLALTLMAVGVVAALGVAAARRGTGRFDALFARAPYLSAALIAAIAGVMLWSGLTHLAGHG